MRFALAGQAVLVVGAVLAATMHGQRPDEQLPPTVPQWFDRGDGLP